MRSSYKLLWVVAFAGAGMLTQPATADTGKSWWITMGIGAGSVEVEKDPDVGAWLGNRLAVSWCKGGGFWTIMFSGCSEFNFLSPPDPLESVGDFGVLYGKRWTKSKIGFAAVSGGIAYVSGMRRGQFVGTSGEGGLFSTTRHYEEKPFATVGLPVNAQCCWAIRESFGLSVDLLGNLNPERSFGALLVSLIVGKLR